MKNLLLIICIALIFSCKDNSNVETLDKIDPQIASEINTLEGRLEVSKLFEFQGRWSRRYHSFFKY